MAVAEAEAEAEAEVLAEAVAAIEKEAAAAAAIEKAAAVAAAIEKAKAAAAAAAIEKEAAAAAAIEKDFPDDLIRDIIGRLPDYKSLCRFQTICKSWDFWIVDEIKRRDPKLVFVGSRTLFSADLDSPKKLKRHFPPPEILQWSNWILRGSCNGLILFTTSSHFILCRKFFSEYQLITPRPEFMISKAYPKAQKFLLHGFGYDPVSEDYKVVVIMVFYSGRRKNGPTGHEIKVFSLRKNAWTSPQTTTPLPFISEDCFATFISEDCFANTRAVLVGSGIHWLAYRDYMCETPPFILAFDLTTDGFREIELPEKTKATALGALGGCLTATHPKNALLEFWVMKEYMVKESWTLLFRISMINRGVDISNFTIPLAFSRNGGKILLESWNDLLWYDPGNDKLVPLRINPKLEDTIKTTVCLRPTNEVFHCQSPSKLIYRSWDSMGRKRERGVTSCATQNFKKRTR
ncbi:hypothetical protein SLA2020_301120 [Shorea laevis]